MNLNQFSTIRRLILQSSRIYNRFPGHEHPTRHLKRFNNHLTSNRTRLLRASQSTRKPTLIARIPLSLTRRHKYHVHQRLGPALEIRAISNLSRPSHPSLRRVVIQLTAITRSTYRMIRRQRVRHSRFITSSHASKVASIRSNRLHRRRPLTITILATPQKATLKQCPQYQFQVTRDTASSAPLTYVLVSDRPSSASIRASSADTIEAIRTGIFITANDSHQLKPYAAVIV